MSGDVAVALLIWTVVGAVADTSIHMMMTGWVGRDLADKLFNVSATRMMALFGVMQIAKAYQ